MTERTIDQRIAILGNAGSGKSTLARVIASAEALPHLEVDRLLWRSNWEPVPKKNYDQAHERAIARTRWVMDGLGQRRSIQARLERATRIILVDMPLWVHFWVAAERQIAWSQGMIEHSPAGAAAPPPTKALFRTIWEVDKDWMPAIRTQIDVEQQQGKRVDKITSFDQLSRYAEAKTIA